MGKDKVSDDVRLELIYSDATQFKYWRSTLFNDVYLKKDLVEKHKDIWDEDDTVEFDSFLNTLRNLAIKFNGKDKVLNKWSETQTINSWIKHVLKALGWSNNCGELDDPFLEETSFRFRNKTLRTDILLVDMPQEKEYITKKKGDDRLVEARQSVLLPVEAKAWNVLEFDRQGIADGKKEADDIEGAVSPNDQVLQYMQMLNKKWGMLTDGSTWRLFNLDMSLDDSNRCYEFNLSALINSIRTEQDEQDRRETIESAKFFFHFFGKHAFVSEDNSDRSFVDEVLNQSKRYLNNVEEDLKVRFVSAMNYVCNGLYDAKSETDGDPYKFIRRVAESALFNVLFCKALESRNVLPMSATDYRKISLSRLIDKIERFDPEKDDDVNIRHLRRSFRKGNGNAFEYVDDGIEIHENIVRLTKIIHDGRSSKDDFGFEISGFRESIFTPKEWQYFQNNPISNIEWIRALFEIGYSKSGLRSRKYQQIPYGYFTPRQLGSIYESFLEYKIDEAPYDMAYEKKQWNKANLSSQNYINKDIPKVKKGELFFTPDNEDRRASGSYFTPDFVVKYMVEKLVLPRIKNRSSHGILETRVCDPAMGSGHFLVEVLKVLTREYMDALKRESDGDLKMTVPEAKRIVLDSCIFGVDLNDRAVKLAKMSLWLESAHINKKLERLDDQLFLGNSIIPKEKLTRSEISKWPLAFDWSKLNPENLIVVGNPPWGAKISSETRTKLSSLYNLDLENLNSFEAFLLLPKFIKNEDTSFIVPRNFIRTDGYATARRELLNKMGISSIADFGACFDGVTQEAVSIQYSASKADRQKIDLIPFAKHEDYTVHGTIPQSKVEASDKSRINILFNERAERIAQKIEGSRTSLTQLVDHFRGIEYGKNGEVTECPECQHYCSLPKKKNKTKKCPNCKTEISIETSKPYNFILKKRTRTHATPIVVGKVIQRFSCSEFYYMQKNLPGIDYKEQAFRKGDKILLMKISDSLKGYLDTENCYTTQGIYMLYPQIEKSIPAGAILGVLNSRLMNFYYEYRVNMGASLTTNVVLEDILL